MIDDYRALAVFATVAEGGGFAAAARKLKLSTSVVSHHVCRLEQRLGVSLFFRSTRSISLTAEGVSLLPAAKRLVQAGNEAMDALVDNSDQPVGSLRVATLAFFGEHPVTKRVWKFAQTNPMVAMNINMSEVPIDLVKDEFDVAIPLGKLEDSALRTRKVGTFHGVLVASPDYLKGQAPIKSPTDVAKCDIISMAPLPDGFTLQKGQQVVDVHPENIRIEVNTVAATKDAILAGLGIQRIPLSEVEDELSDGRLVKVLPDWDLPVANAYAMWPAAAQQKNLTRLFIDDIARADLI